jgi:hypothetical protein
MLTALFSASAGQALVPDDQRFILLDLANSPDGAPIDANTARLIFSGESDLTSIEIKDPEAFGKSIRLDWHVDRALRMLQILLDTDEPSDLRQDAMSAFDALVSDGDVARIVRYYCYSQPLGSGQAAPSNSHSINANTAEKFIDGLLAH